MMKHFLMKLMVTTAVVTGLSGANLCAQASVSTQRLAAVRNSNAARQAAVRQQALANQQALALQRARAANRVAGGSGSYTTARARTGQPTVAGVTSARSVAGGGVRSTASSASLAGIQTAIQAFSVDMGRAPTAAEGLGALINRPPGATNWRGPYISTVNWHTALTDPWGNPYRYNVQGDGRYVMHIISSDGPDRIAGTSDDLSVQF